MTHVTRILPQIEQGDPQAAERLLPLVCERLRKLAAQKRAQEKPGRTVQAAAFVQESHVRLGDIEKASGWDSGGRFFVDSRKLSKVRQIRVGSQHSQPGYLSRPAKTGSSVSARCNSPRTSPFSH